MKNVITLIIFVLYSFTCFSQKDEKQVNYFHNVKFGEQYGVFINTNNVVSKFNYVKLALVITNKTDNYLLLKKDKCKFVFDNNSYFPKAVKKAKIIKPNSKKAVTVKVSEEANYLVDLFSFQPNGIFSISSTGKVLKVEPFHLPPSKNTIEIGNFKINMLKLKKETQETIVKFECKYTGDKIAIITPANCVLRTVNGKEWANLKSKDKKIVLQKNESKKFNVIFKIPAKSEDMQFAEMDIVWKNTFQESELKELKFDVQTIEIDKVKTDSKRKK